MYLQHVSFQVTFPHICFITYSTIQAIVEVNLSNISVHVIFPRKGFMACMTLIMSGPEYIQTGHIVFNMYVFIVT